MGTLWVAVYPAHVDRQPRSDSRLRVPVIVADWRRCWRRDYTGDPVFSGAAPRSSARLFPHVIIVDAASCCLSHGRRVVGAERIWTCSREVSGIHPDLQDVPSDPVPILLLFAHQYCTGCIAPGDRPAVRSRTVEDAVRQHVAQAFTRVGTIDPRLSAFGTLDFRLHSHFQHAWKHVDPPLTRVP